MLTLRNELKEHLKILEFFKDLPVDLKNIYKVSTFHSSLR